MYAIRSYYVLTATATTTLYGRLSDIHGRRPLFFIAIGLFIVGSLLCGLAQSMTQLIALRALQGLGVITSYSIHYTKLYD